MDSWHKNKKIGFYLKPLQLSSNILCVVNDSHTNMKKKLLCAPQGSLRRPRFARNTKIGFYKNSLWSFLRILCLVDDYHIYMQKGLLVHSTIIFIQYLKIYNKGTKILSHNLLPLYPNINLLINELNNSLMCSYTLQFPPFIQ